MTAPSNPALSGHPFRIADAPSIEAVELELALQLQPPVDFGFETALDSALERVGGTLLFHLKVDTLPDCQRVAAVSVGAGEERQLVLVILPADGGPPRVETTLDDANPVAGFARSYVGLMDRLARS